MNETTDVHVECTVNSYNSISNHFYDLLYFRYHFTTSIDTWSVRRRLKFYVLTHNNLKNPEYVIAISLLQVRLLIYLFLMILGPNFKLLWSMFKVDGLPFVYKG